MSTAEEMTPTQKLLTMLNLQERKAFGSDQHSFAAETLSRESPRIFGGQVLAQAVMAASRSVEADRALHSLHAYFLRPGSVDAQLTLGVQDLNDGRSFSTRRVHAYQEGLPIFSCIASFQTASAGPEHSSPMPEGLPDPETLPSVAELIGHVQIPVAQAVAFDRPFDLRHVDAPLYMQADPTPAATNAVWFKTFESLPDDPVLHRAAIAYASDYTQIEPVLRRHGKFWLEPGMKVASLDHAIWFHRDARADEWLLLVQDSPSAGDARGLSLGKIFTRDGKLVATVAQESMVRLPEYQ